jgi:hypothetical protein
MTLKRLTLVRLATALCLLVVLVACGDNGGSFPTHASTLSQPREPPPAPPIPPPRTITIGETINERINVATGQAYRVTVTQTGTLVVNVSYDVSKNSPLEVYVERLVTGPTTAPAGSPIIARFPVVAGQSYSFSVGIREVDFIPAAEYTLTTSIE